MLVNTQVSDNFGSVRQFLAQQDRSPNTIKNYLADLVSFSTWLTQTTGEGLTPENLTPTDVRLYRQFLQVVRKAAPATINRKLASLRMYAASACAQGDLDANPLTDVRGVAEQKTAPKWLDRKQQAALMRLLERNQAAAKTEAGKRQAQRDRCIVTLLMNTGLRISELCSLDWSDIHLTDRKGELQVRSGKGGKARTIPLNNSARSVLKSWREAGHGEREAQPGSVFSGKRGARLAESGVQRLVKEYGRRAQVEVTPHTLRHTFAKNLVDAGVSLEKVAMLLGHSSLNTTRIYTTPSLQDLDRAVSLLDG